MVRDGFGLGAPLQCPLTSWAFDIKSLPNPEVHHNDSVVSIEKNRARRATLSQTSFQNKNFRQTTMNLNTIRGTSMKHLHSLEQGGVTTPLQQKILKGTPANPRISLLNVMERKLNPFACVSAGSNLLYQATRNLQGIARRNPNWWSPEWPSSQLRKRVTTTRAQGLEPTERRVIPLHVFLSFLWPLRFHKGTTRSTHHSEGQTTTAPATASVKSSHCSLQTSSSRQSYQVTSAARLHVIHWVPMLPQKQEASRSRKGH